MKTYLVGGAVRDTLLGIYSNDNDYVVVGSTPEEMTSLGFSKVGASFPVFLHPKTGEEYSLARKDKKVGTGYLGFECVFTPDITLEEDLYRRDLTINSMAIDSDSNLIDPYGGKDDLSNKVLRHTSDAFVEDPLRIIRLARFYGRFKDFTIHESTKELCIKNVLSLNEIHSERFWLEIEKVIIEQDAETFKRFVNALMELRVLEHVPFFNNALPYLFSYDEYDLSYVLEDMNVFSAAFSGPHTNLFFSSNAERLSKALNKLPPMTGEDLYETIKILGGYNTVLDELFCSALMSGKQVERMYEFRHGFNASKLVNSNMFPTLDGVQLGQAIKKLQIKILDAICR